MGEAKQKQTRIIGKYISKEASPRYQSLCPLCHAILPAKLRVGRIMIHLRFFSFKIFSTILEVEIQNQDRVGRIVLGVSQFHGYANDFRRMGTEPRHQESVSQSIPSITVKSGCHGNWG